jgi:hypothetical protein
MAVYDVGDTAALDQFRVATAAGVLTDDAATAVTVIKPDGTTTTPTPVHTSTGLYDATVSVDQAGEWTWLWSAPTVGTKQPGQFSAVSPRVLVADFEEFRKHLNRTDLTDDAELRTYLFSATDYVEYLIGGPVSVQTFTEQVLVRGDAVTPLKKPLVSVTSLTPDLGSAMDSSQYVVDTARGVIWFRYPHAYGLYTLVYRAGLAVIQERHKLAGLIIAAHLWEVQNGGGGLPFPGDQGVPTYWQGYAIPNRAKELLAPDMPMLLA